jgi:hypothetical protein
MRKLNENMYATVHMTHCFSLNLSGFFVGVVLGICILFILLVAIIVITTHGGKKT